MLQKMRLLREKYGNQKFLFQKNLYPSIYNQNQKMQSLPRNEYPKDFYYHRTSAEGYRKYLSAGGLTTFDLPNSPQYAWIKKVFGNFFAIIKYERTDTEPDIDWIRKHL